MRSSQHQSVPFSDGVEPPCTRVPALSCDCHVHVYGASFPVATDARLRPPAASADDYRKLQGRIGTSRVVLVTPSTYGTDNACLLAGLASFGDAARGVAVISGREDAAALQRLPRAGVRGARVNLARGGGPEASALGPLADRLAVLGWHLQLLMPADELVRLAPLLRGLAVPIVFDHFGRVPQTDARHPARDVILGLLEQERAWVKLSGGYLASASGTVEDRELDLLAGTYLDAAPDRVVWGSNWPHPTASAGHHPFPDDARQIDRLAEWAGSAQRLQQVLVANPQRLYGF